MAFFEIPYGRRSLRFRLPDAWDVSVFAPEGRAGLADPRQAAEAALDALDGEFEAGKGRSSAAIAVNDKTRPVPHEVLLPALIGKLERWGYAREEITLVIAVGAHAPMTPEEFSLVVPPGAAEGCRIVSHDADDAANLIFLGETALGTPCSANRLFAEADLRIVVGNIEPHQFMGWSGGAKSAAIGLAGRKTIEANHSRMDMDGAGPCRFRGNPVRQDVEEMGRMIGVHMALNVVMNGGKEIVGVFAGSPDDVMERGTALASALFRVEAGDPADLVIASAGGAPKDINLYQAQKALRHGAMAAKAGAPVIVAAECPEGLGSEAYESWMDGKETFASVRESFAFEGFRLGPHKAMLFAEDAEDRKVYLVSELSDDAVRSVLLEPSATVEEAVGATIESRGSTGSRRRFRVAVLPYANATIPEIRSGCSAGN